MGMKEFETKVLGDIASDVSNEDWNIAFPGLPKPMGASLAGHTQALIEAKKTDIGLAEKQARLEQAQLENPSVVQDVSDYIVTQDKQLKKIDALMSDAETQMARNSDFPALRNMNADYINYLNTMRGKTVQRYSSYLNQAVDLRNVEVSRLQSEVDKALAEVNQASSLIQAKSEEDYSRILSIIDENWQKPQLAAQTEAQRLKDEKDLRKTQIEELENLQKIQDKVSDDYIKNRDEVRKQVKDTDGSWKIGKADITALIATDASTNPKAVYDVMEEIMPSDILRVEKDVANESLPGLYGKQKRINTYLQAISSRYADLKNTEQAAITAAPLETDPDRKIQIGNVQAMATQELAQLQAVQTKVADAVVQRMKENFALIDDNEVNKMRNFFVTTEGHWYNFALPKAWEKATPSNFDDSRKSAFIKQFGDKLQSSDVAGWIFDTIKKQSVSSATIHNAPEKADARFFFDSQEALGGTQTRPMNVSQLATEVSRNVFYNFGLADLATE